MRNNRKTKALERVFPQKQPRKPRVRKFAILTAALMGVGAAIAQAVKRGDQQ